MTSSHDSHEADPVGHDDTGSSNMKWIGPLIALLFCVAILAGIGVANAASYDGELPHHDDEHGEEHGDDDGDHEEEGHDEDADDHGDEEDHSEEEGDDEDHE